MEKGSERAGLAGWPGVCLLGWLASLSLTGTPDIGGNEATYLLEPLLLSNPSLMPDLPVPEGPRGLFNLLVSVPMRWMDLLAVALTVRFASAAAVILAMAWWTRKLGCGPYQFLAGFLLWLFSSQPFWAGEWVLGFAEAKPFAYALVVASLALLASDRPCAAGAAAGLATSFHVLIGGWSVPALLAAVLWQSGRRRGWRAGAGDAAKAALLALAVAMPGLWPALGYVGPPATQEQHRLIVLTNFFHMDPFWFLTPVRCFMLLVILFCVVMTLLRLSSPGGRSLVPYVGVVTAIWVGGVIARLLGTYGFLRFYPFRLFDGLMPMLAIFCSIMAIGGRSEDPETDRRLRFLRLLSAVLILVYFTLFRLQPLFHQPSDRLREWKHYLAVGTLDRMQSATDWIKANTPADAIFISPPQEPQFTIKALRRTVLSIKRIPHNTGISDWARRSEALLGPGADAAFRGQGQSHYDNLGPEELQSIAREYGASYYLVEKSRSELGYPLVYSDGAFYLYALPGNATSSVSP